MSAIARRALRDQRRAPLTWGVSLGLLCALELAIYPSVHESLSKTLTSYPDAIKQAFRIDTFNTPAAFVNAVVVEAAEGDEVRKPPRPAHSSLV